MKRYTKSVERGLSFLLAEANAMLPDIYDDAKNGSRERTAGADLEAAIDWLAYQKHKKAAKGTP